MSIATRILRMIALGYGIILLLAIALEDWLVYMPQRYPAGNWDTSDLAVEDVFLNSADGTRIHGWYVPCEDAIASVLFLHGNGGNITDWLPQLYYLHHKTQVNVLAIDYRGFGKSNGFPSEAGVLQDARAGRRWLAERQQIDEADIVLMGRSLGGGIAIQLAVELNPRALILERTFTSLPDAAFAQYPILPTKLLMRNRFNSLSAIRRYPGPLLQSHGTDDRIVPYDQGVAVFDAAPGTAKEFISVNGGTHHSPQPNGYFQHLRDFLQPLAPLL